MNDIFWLKPGLFIFLSIWTSKRWFLLVLNEVAVLLFSHLCSTCVTAMFAKFSKFKKTSDCYLVKDLVMFSFSDFKTPDHFLKFHVSLSKILKAILFIPGVKFVMRIINTGRLKFQLRDNILCYSHFCLQLT